VGIAPKVKPVNENKKEEIKIAFQDTNTKKQ
jgi:hypothetical protein